MSNRVNLHNELRRRRFDFALLATYEFDAPFFESFALEKLDAFASNNAIIVFLDTGTHQGLLNAPSGKRARLAGLRYVLVPVRCGGVFHPKVFLLAARRHGLLIIGSANLTRAGLSRNAEFVTALRYELGEQEDHLPLFQDTFALVARFTERWGTPTVEETLRQMQVDCPWLVHATPGSGQRCDSLLHNLDAPLWPQLVESTSTKPRQVRVLSPYFDAEPKILDEILPTVGTASIVLQTERGRTTMTPRWLDHPAVRQGHVAIAVGSYADGDQPQRLHAKAIGIHTPSETLVAFGSANFTRPALVRTADEGNVETLLVVRGLPAETSLEELFDPSGVSRTAESRDLNRDPPSNPPIRESYDILLIEASLEEGELTLLTSGAIPDTRQISAEIALEERRSVVLSMQPGGGETLVATISPELRGDLATSSATVQLIVRGPDDHEHRSNQVFLVNLQDAPTGRRRRQERRLREAQQSSAHFTAVLQELLVGGDDESLSRFLALCNIKIGAGIRVGFGRSPRDAWTPGTTRVLGTRNIELFSTIHEAAINFVDRHLKRLRHHAKRPTLSSVPSAMHVSRAVAEVIRAQLDRLVTGLESIDRPLQPQRWGRCRTEAGLYLSRLDECLKILNGDYLVALERRHGTEAVGPLLRPDLGPLEEIASGIFGVRARLAKAELRVLTRHGPIEAPYFRGDLLEPHRFSVLVDAAQTELSSLRSVAGGGHDHAAK